MLALLLKLLPIAVPVFPLVRWPIAARLAPQIQDIAKGLYIAAWGLGLAQGFNLGLWAGTVIGSVATTVIFSFVYWGFFKKVSDRR